MLRDPTALLNIQIAFMGIVLVVGLFYLWKMMKKIEGKVTKLTTTIAKVQEQMDARGATPTASANAEEDAMAQAIMNEVFGGGAAPMFLHPFSGGNASTSSVVVEEAPEEASPEVAATAATAGPAPSMEDDADTHSVGTTSMLSKSKVRKMSAEALREICKERGLDTEGTKAILMERVLATLDD